MSILSSIGNAISGAVNAVGNTVTKVVQTVVPGGNSGYLPPSSNNSNYVAPKTSSSSSGSSSGSSMGSGGGTYNSSTGTYIDSSGQGYSTATQPSGSTSSNLIPNANGGFYDKTSGVTYNADGTTTAASSSSTSTSTQTGNPTNSYDSSTGTYTDTSGQGVSTQTAPAGSTLTGGMSTTYQGAPSTTNAFGMTTPNNAFSNVTSTPTTPSVTSPSSTGTATSSATPSVSTGQVTTPPLNSLDYVNSAMKKLGQGDLGGFFSDLAKGASAPYAPKEQNDAALNQLGGIALMALPVGGVGKLAEAENLLAKSVTELEALAKSAGKIEAVGKLAQTVGGAEKIASTIPEAAGVAPKAAEVGAVTKNTNVVTKAVNFVGDLFSAKGIKGYLGYGAVVGAVANKVWVDNEITSYIQKSTPVATDLYNTGNPEFIKAADAIIATNKDLRDGLDVFWSYIPFLGKMVESNKVANLMDTLATDIAAYDRMKASDKKFADDTNARVRGGFEVSNEDLMKAAGIDPTGAASKELDKRNQAINNPVQPEQPAPETPKEEPAPVPENYAGSTLNFGLLKTGGATEQLGEGAGQEQVEQPTGQVEQPTGTGTTGTLSNKDEIAQYLFNKLYAECSPEQKSVVDKWLR